MADIMKMFTTVYKDKIKAKQQAQSVRNAKYQKKQKIEELKNLQKHKRLKRMVYERIGQMESRKTKANARRGRTSTTQSD
jgi:uncharacterized metal-binding protein